jgi:ABC-type nitrate/sulfonate/bicarbonate transport system permease component
MQTTAEAPAATGELASRSPLDWARNTKLPGILLIVALLLVWELLAAMKIVDTPSFPRVSTILSRWGQLIVGGEIPLALLPTFKRIALGFFLAIALAVPLGVLMGYSRIAFNTFEPLTEVLRPIPASALVPILILFLGIDDEMKVFLVVFASFFPILLNTYSGVRSVDPVLIQTARTLGLPRRRIIWKTIIPAASPYIFTGMRISLAVSLILTVIAEMVAGNSGIGFFTLFAQRSFRVPDMYSGIITLGIVGYGLNALFLLVEQRVMKWHIGYSQQRQ